MNRIRQSMDPPEPEAFLDPAKKHRLRQPFSFWFMKRQLGRTQESYEKSMKFLGTFDTVEDFWTIYNHLAAPGEAPSGSGDYMVFRKGVKPMWEDKENSNGGSFVLRFPHSKRLPRLWEDLILALIGAQFCVPDEEICGVVVSTRFNQKDVLSIWCKHSDLPETRQKVHDSIKRILGLPPHTQIEFKYHNQSMKDSQNPNREDFRAGQRFRFATHIDLGDDENEDGHHIGDSDGF